MWSRMTRWYAQPPAATWLVPTCSPHRCQIVPGDSVRLRVTGAPAPEEESESMVPYSGLVNRNGDGELESTDFFTTVYCPKVKLTKGK